MTCIVSCLRQDRLDNIFFECHIAEEALEGNTAVCVLEDTVYISSSGGSPGIANWTRKAKGKYMNLVRT